MTILKRALACLLCCCLLAGAAGCKLQERKEDAPDESSAALESPPTARVVPANPPGESGDPYNPGGLGPESSGQESSGRDEDRATVAMAGDLTQFAALSSELVEWGSGGPTDDEGRPNGATSYQQKYGKYDAFFLVPESDKLYLTFDEGYEYGFTPVILDTLKEKNVKAVFFVTMHFAESEPDLIRRIIDEGHILGNHSARHKSYPTLPLSEAVDDLMALHDYVKETYGYEMRLFRYPEGKFSEQTLAAIQSCGYKSLFWSFAYVDYYVDNQPLTIDALDKITSKAHPGALYLFHAVSRTNSEILGEAVDLLRGQGYEFADWEDFAK